MLTPLRDTITKAYRMDETECLNRLIPLATFAPQTCEQILEIARQLVVETREYKKKQNKIDVLLHQYDLSTEEGIALMCMAEALLRIPDKATMDKFIADKLSTVAWQNHLSTSHSLFVNAATWSLLLTGKIYGTSLNTSENYFSALQRAVGRLGIAVIRPIILQMMKAIGTQFVMGQTIESALERASKLEQMGYRFSYDMLGEAARTAEDAESYYQSYVHAIDAIGQVAHAATPAENPGISIKLSALDPRYDYTQRARVLAELPPRLLALAQQAKRYNIGLTVDAEEADRLDLSLDIFAKVFCDPSLEGWEGFGLAVQAYQKRSSYVIDWLQALATEHKKRMMVRLVKGAYWDAEIKQSQILGLKGYPVFTRKNATDVSYLACAKKLLAHPECFYSQFGTHNAYSVAAILEIGKDQKNDYEFQCLHGMGRPLYDQIVSKNGFDQPTRIYAPVGTHRDLLGYLVRRLLENGANSSFVNKLADDQTPIDQIVFDPVARMAALEHKPHPKIPLPKDIYGAWQNSAGIDLSDSIAWHELAKQMTDDAQVVWNAGSIINGIVRTQANHKDVICPSDTAEIVGQVSEATVEEVEEALAIASKSKLEWQQKEVNERAKILEHAADLLQVAMPSFITLITREGGRSIPDGISEVREAIDFCRYYAYRARIDLAPTILPGPTGESNELSLHGRGVVVCISPWNFPLAIFTGQIVAALVAGNTVIAKPAEQTPLVAFKMIQLLHEAGVPKNVLQLILGKGSKVGAKLVSDERIAGVMFTGSTDTAKSIEKALANRSGSIGFLVAETGGQNAMLVDSSALPEQVVFDIANSAFNSAGQRCSALRVLFVQEEIAPKLLTMLKGYMAELIIGNPAKLSTDVGPVIDSDALKMLRHHYARMQKEATLIAEVPYKNNLPGYYFPPCAFEIDAISVLEGEIFGPILHVVRYKATDFDKVLDAITATQFGLTLGVHSRIDTTIQAIAKRMPVGNLYVNRNMIGAVVGVQPFGGENLSGTGPKAGGPHYLLRLCVERAISINTTAVGGNARLVSLLEED